MKLKNYILSFNLLKNFLELEIHYGFLELNRKNSFNSYLYGLRNKINIINLNWTYKSLKQFFFILLYFLKDNKKIIFIGFPNWFNEKWKLLEMISDKNYIFLEYHWKYKYLRKNRKKIGTIIVFNDYFFLTELEKLSNQLNIPLLGFSSNNINTFDYLIPGNFNSQKGVLFLYYFFFNLIRFKYL